MARLVVYIPDHERKILQELAQREYRAPHAQASFMLRAELERLGLLHSATGSDTRSQEEASNDSPPRLLNRRNLHPNKGNCSAKSTTIS